MKFLASAQVLDNIRLFAETVMPRVR